MKKAGGTTVRVENLKFFFVFLEHYEYVEYVNDSTAVNPGKVDLVYCA